MAHYEQENVAAALRLNVALQLAMSATKMARFPAPSWLLELARLIPRSRRVYPRTVGYYPQTLPRYRPPLLLLRGLLAPTHASVSARPALYAYGLQELVQRSLV